MEPCVLDMYHCSLVVPEVSELLRNVAEEYPADSTFKIENPTEEDRYTLFPFIIGVISVMFRRKGFSIDTDYPLENFYEIRDIEESIDMIESEESNLV